MRGGRRAKDRNELLARRLRKLRSLQGETVQPGDGGHALKREVDLGRTRNDGRRGGLVFQRDSAIAAEAPDPARCGPRIYQVGAAGDDPFGGGGAAGKTLDRTLEGGDRQDTLYTG